MPGLSPAMAAWWRERGEPRALSALALLALSLPPLLILELITPYQAGRLALLLAWAAAALLCLRLPALLRREGRRITLLIGVVAVALGGAATLAREPEQASAQSGLAVQAPPRIARQTFEAILQRGGSPAASVGGELYDIIAGYGLDPAVALAFFQHESQFCTTGACARNDLKNWGMQRRPTRAERGAGQVGGFTRYGSWQDSVRDWSELILGRYVARGLDTVEKIIPVYAPRADRNVPEAYINAIRRLVASWSGRRITPAVQIATYASLDQALVSETFLAAEIQYRPEWAFHTFMLNEARAGRPLGAPLGDSKIVTAGNQRFAIQVFALDTLYTPIAEVESETNWGDVRRLSDLLRGQPPQPAPAGPTATTP